MDDLNRCSALHLHQEDNNDDQDYEDDEDYQLQSLGGGVGQRTLLQDSACSIVEEEDYKMEVI